MAGFFGDIGKKVSSAAQAAAKKSGELVEVTKINMEINKTEEIIKKQEIEIGKKVYENFKDGTVDETYKELCETIKISEDKVKELKSKIMDVKGLKVCTGCGVELATDVMFCAKCGTKQEEVASSEPEGKTCTACGASIPVGSAFCTSCGAKSE
jgi:ribosomal protein L40E